MSKAQDAHDRYVAEVEAKALRIAEELVALAEAEGVVGPPLKVSKGGTISVPPYASQYKGAKWWVTDGSLVAVTDGKPRWFGEGEGPLMASLEDKITLVTGENVLVTSFSQHSRARVAAAERDEPTLRAIRGREQKSENRQVAKAFIEDIVAASRALGIASEQHSIGPYIAVRWRVFDASSDGYKLQAEFVNRDERQRYPRKGWRDVATLRADGELVAEKGYDWAEWYAKHGENAKSEIIANACREAAIADIESVAEQQVVDATQLADRISKHVSPGKKARVGRYQWEVCEGSSVDSRPQNYLRRTNTRSLARGSAVRFGSASPAREETAKSADDAEKAVLVDGYRDLVQALPVGEQLIA